MHEHRREQRHHHEPGRSGSAPGRDRATGCLRLPELLAAGTDDLRLLPGALHCPDSAIQVLARIGVIDRDRAVFERALVDRPESGLIEPVVGREIELPDENNEVDGDDRPSRSGTARSGCCPSAARTPRSLEGGVAEAAHFAAAQWVYGRHGERAGTVANGRSWRHRRDRRARPRFNQGVTGIVSLLGAVFGWPLAWALMAAQLLIGLTVGRRFCLPCAAYFTLVQPRRGQAEDAARRAWPT